MNICLRMNEISRAIHRVNNPRRVISHSKMTSVLCRFFTNEAVDKCTQNSVQIQNHQTLKTSYHVTNTASHVLCKRHLQVKYNSFVSDAHTCEIKQK